MKLKQLIKKRLSWLLQSNLTRKINIFIHTAFTQYPFFSSVYYLFSAAFNREHHTVLAGLINHNRLHLKQQNYYTLRRNIHRLEKGLLMRPQRDLFATDYIEETVAHYLALQDNTNIAEGIRWCSSVLHKYFTLVDDSHPKIKLAKQQFLNNNIIIQSDSDAHIPYQRPLSPPDIPSVEQLHNLMIHRRSIRWYLPKAVPRELIDHALSIAALSPSACNRQPFRFIILDNLEQVKKIARLAGGTVGFADNIPVLMVVVGQLNAFFSERDRHLIYIDSALAAMSFMLALETLELSSCPLNWPDVPYYETQITKALSLKSYERVIMLMSVGYADPTGYVAYSQKKSLNELRYYS